MNATRDCYVSATKTAFFQDAARREFEDRTGRTLMPWAWILNTCDSAQCLNPDHMVVHAPTKIAYPAGICVYCGLGAGTRDHLIPRGKSGEARRYLVAVVPACSECNNRINDHPAHSVSERRRVAHASLRKAKRKLLQAPEWTPDEMGEFGPSLRAYIERSAHDKALVRVRLAWPDDPFYDIRAFQKSGIDDPVGLGMCDSPLTTDGADLFAEGGAA